MGNCHNSSYNLGVPDQRFSHLNSLGCSSRKNWSQFFQYKLDKIDQKIADYVEKSRRKPHNFCTLKKLEKLKSIKRIIPNTFKPQSQTRFENDDLFMANLSKENELLMCEYCQKMVPSSTYKDHINECAQIFEATNASLQENYKDSIQINEEDSNEYLTTTCCYCSQEILLEYYDYHLDECKLNQINLNQRQHPKGRDSMLNNKSTQVRECAICLQTMKDDKNTKFLACAHQFHSDCIEDWYRKKKTCPVCQSDFS